MMKLLDRYILGQFIKYTLLVLGSLITIYLLVDLFERLDNFLDAKKSVGLLIRYLLLKIPLIHDQVIPVCLLLAAVITLGVLNHNRELPALKAAGISVTRIIRPLIIGSLGMTLLTMASAEWLLPSTLAESNKIWYVEVKNTPAKGINRNGRNFFRGSKGIYTFVQKNQTVYDFVEFLYCRLDTDFSPALLLSANRATWDNGIWTFYNGQMKRKNPISGYSVEPFTTATFDLPDKPEEFFLPIYKLDELSLSQHVEKALLEDTQGNTQAWSEINKRISYIFLGVPLILLGMPLLLLFQRQRGRDLALAIPASCGLAFLAWGWWSTAQSMARAGLLPASVASWSVHFVIGFLGLMLIRYQNR